MESIFADRDKRFGKRDAFKAGAVIERAFSDGRHVIADCDGGHAVGVVKSVFGDGHDRLAAIAVLNRYGALRSRPARHLISLLVLGKPIRKSRFGVAHKFVRHRPFGIGKVLSVAERFHT